MNENTLYYQTLKNIFDEHKKDVLEEAKNYGDDLDTFDKIVESDYADDIFGEFWDEILTEIHEYIYSAWCNSSLQLHDKHTLWKINNEDLPDDFIELYSVDVTAYCDLFVTETGVEIYCLGRSGRHVCVDLTLDNLKRYEELRKLALEYEKCIIDYYNNYKDEVSDEKV